MRAPIPIDGPSRSAPTRTVSGPLAIPITATAIATLVAALSLAFAVGESFAHGGATGIVKTRMDAMKRMGDHARAVGDMLKGKRALDADTVREAAASFVEHGTRIPELFPDTEASREGATTEALPAIWRDWEGFTALTARFVEDSGTLATVAGTLGEGVTLDDPEARALKGAFFRAAKGCSGCHERFRLDRD